MPAVHSVHEATFDDVEYLPAAHSLHLVAPPAVPVFVIDPASHALQSAAFVDPLPATYLPAAQLVHAESVDAVEYLPAAHWLHAIAPVAEPVFVIEPASHSEQYDFALSP